MTQTILRSIVDDATAWKGPELADDQSWIHRLDAADNQEIARAYQSVKSRDLRWGDFGKADFALPRLSQRLARVDDQIRNGRGFALMRGFNVDAYTLEELKTIYWGLGVHMGQVISHNVAGDFVAPVTNMGLTDSDPNRRKNTTAQLLDPHTDLADVVALMCVEKASQRYLKFGIPLRRSSMIRLR